MDVLDFRFRFAKKQLELMTLLCVGLDPDIALLPAVYQAKIEKAGSDEEKAYIVLDWAKEIVDATIEHVCMYKPQIAHWEALGTSGLKVLTLLVSYIHAKDPWVVVFLDCKRGDIDNTQDKYGVACFEKYGVDGMNFSPYMGKSCMKALYNKNHPERSLVGLCYTSNPDAREMQDVVLADSGDTYWQYTAKRTLAWAEELGLGVLNNAGLVMAAAYPDKNNPEIIHSEHLVICRKIVGDKLWFLIPGIGAQGGLMKETIVKSYTEPGSIVVTESRSIIFASKGDDYALSANLAAEKSHNTMKQVLASM
ncbi:MAG: Orotidine 5'-phosphate decarboxylase [Candidatus Nomurabacteria bacterium GW2011_GWF2_35_66]|uniref:Orotidine-5'-phosphate decarboxylase n=1 Tax=Candidatus Nomurabacteria bacterium GW2011_GWE1_35_16 TaxID=1618761 RepID=A0A0G0BSF2_9BACT|nr:MAG: Orotidine 5'-phosphate decarboxylase [Candidatus Nomurabacteria bacterium GW2011_GWF1_34_20]KKP63369.1 MAG: Orotidine 5'-phosphate decarboxylase [Candidatus Nomurabacteria bacterium GW2011_GWE2_34_25]KKP66561.1 MAG: Orotidine 5'-phosphate decarboxylase [Candidatus Nomurabacteria bacterium GW2011_GWE1_35_16]KKP83607.1 MAG: Orotidine 5'-phosphate decarboxylase [Candidatus Nomurabacteria bacterium GW2011_GWF2_35_66]HAE36867.1 orotidine-5'-phosphate decarboxylase [Candidatus Nomurabacteria 